VRRLLTAALLAVVVSALTFLTLHGMYPEAFGDTKPLLVGAMAFGLLAGAACGAVCARHPGTWRSTAPRCSHCARRCT
jgi:uncharacterized membrane protein YfcA